MGSDHFFTRVIRFDHISIGTIIAGCPQAQGLPWDQIRTFRVNPRIQNRKLIATEGLADARSVYTVAYARRNVLGRRNPIANIALFDNMHARTLWILSENCHRVRQNGKCSKKI